MRGEEGGLKGRKGRERGAVVRKKCAGRGELVVLGVNARSAHLTNIKMCTGDARSDTPHPSNKECAKVVD